MGKDQPAAQHLLPLLHLLHRVYHLGTQKRQVSPPLQLRTDEAAKRRQADDRRVATARHRPLGKILRQASHAEAPRPAHPHHPLLHRQKRLDSRPLRRLFDHRHRRQSHRPPLPWHRARAAVRRHQPQAPRGNRQFQDLQQLPIQDKGHCQVGDIGTVMFCM